MNPKPPPPPPTTCPGAALAFCRPCMRVAPSGATRCVACEGPLEQYAQFPTSLPRPGSREPQVLRLELLPGRREEARLARLRWTLRGITLLRTFAQVLLLLLGLVVLVQLLSWAAFHLGVVSP